MFPCDDKELRKSRPLGEWMGLYVYADCSRARARERSVSYFVLLRGYHMRRRILEDKELKHVVWYVPDDDDNENKH